MEGTKQINPLEIETTAGTQARVSVDQKVVDAYAEDMRNGQPFPSIVVFAEEGSERYILADGFHRLPAHMAAFKDQPIWCDVRKGGIWEAKVHAASANAEHGVRRSNKDIRHGVEILLREPQGEGMADTVLASMARCDPRTVASVREDLILAGDIGDAKTRKHLQKGKMVEKPVPKKKKAAEPAPPRNRKPSEPPQEKTQEEYDRDLLLECCSNIVTLLDGLNGAEAIKRYGLEDDMDSLEKAMSAIDEVLSSADAGDEDEFLKVS